MFFDTLKFVFFTLVALVLFGGLVYLFIAPFNKFNFFMAGQITEPLEKIALEKLTELQSKNYTIAAALYNATIEQSEVYREVKKARENDEIVWLLLPLIGFIGAILFYTGWTQVRT